MIWDFEIRFVHDLALPPMMPCTFVLHLVSLSRSTPAQKVLVLRDYYELCGLSQHFSNTIHVLGTIYDAFKGVREGLGGVHGGCLFS